MDLGNEKDRDKLFAAMNLSYQKLQPFRNLRTSLVEEAAGSNYGYGTLYGAKFETMINLMNQAVDAYTMALVAERPRVSVDTNREDLRFFASHYQQAINNMLQDIDIQTVLQTWVKEAFFLVGIVKAHMGDAGEVELWGQRIDPGSPAASNVGLDDFVYDTSATRMEFIEYAADSYRVPMDLLKGDDRFDQKVVKTLHPTQKRNFVGWSLRAEMLSKGWQSESDDVEDMIDLIDVWSPREGKIYTFPMDTSQWFAGHGDPLDAYDWDGPERGPYHLLGFDQVLDNVMPSGPASQLASMSRLVNNLFRKQAKQARRQKDVGVYTPAGAKTAGRVQQAMDGEWVEAEDISEIGTVKRGGVDPGNQAFMMHVIDVFDRAAGNLPAMLGLGQQADTLGQEQLINGSVSKKEAQMRMKVWDATRRLVRNLAYMLWHDKAKTIPGRMEIPGAEHTTMDATWTPEYRMGEFHEYDLDVDVYSMAFQPPQAKANALMQLMQTIYIPLQPVLQQQGGQIDLQAFTDELKDLLNMPRLGRLITFAAPSPGSQPSSPVQGAPAPMPSQTTRNYVRRSSAGGAGAGTQGPSPQQAWLAASQQQGGGGGMSNGQAAVAAAAQ